MEDEVVEVEVERKGEGARALQTPWLSTGWPLEVTACILQVPGEAEVGGEEDQGEERGEDGVGFLCRGSAREEKMG